MKLLFSLLGGFLLISAAVAAAENLPVDASGTKMQGVLSISTTQKVTTSGASARTANDIVGKIVRVSCSEATFMNMGTSSVTAAATDVFIPANSVEYFHRMSHVRVAFIQSTAAGFCTVTEMQ